MNSSRRISKIKMCRHQFRNIWPSRLLTVKQGHRLIQKRLELDQNSESRPSSSFFLSQFKEKQKFSSLFQGISVRYFAQLFSQLKNQRSMKKIDDVILILERRLDFLLVRLALCRSVSEARQWILHHFIQVNGQTICQKSFLLKNGDVISLNHVLLSQNKNKIQERVHKDFQKFPNRSNILPHLEINYKTLEAIFLYSPQKIDYTTTLDVDLLSHYLQNHKLF